MKYRTKHERMDALIELHYCITHIPYVAPNELESWARRHDLWPVPTLYDGEDEWQEWEDKFDLARQKAATEGVSSFPKAVCTPSAES